MLPLTTLEPRVKFHISLNVPDLGRAVDFYALLFGTAPAKRRADYAKFELEDPPVVFSLAPLPPGAGASLSHLGLRVGSDVEIERYRQQLEQAGVCTQAQDGTVCGYARQNKLWVRDPFGNFWEIYRVEEDVRPELIRRSIEGPSARSDAESTTSPEAARVWEHFVINPAPDRIPHENDALDEVRLTGTFNSDLPAPQRAAILAESLRALRPGGKVVVHGLFSDQPIIGAQPRLDGVAAMVSRVPAHAEPIASLRAAGFVGIQVVKFPERPWFTHNGAELREVKLLAWKPHVAVPDQTRMLLYKGPFAKIRADGGHTYERGKRVVAPVVVWQQLRLGPSAEHFLFFETEENSACGV